MATEGVFKYLGMILGVAEVNRTCRRESPRAEGGGFKSDRPMVLPDADVEEG